MKSKRAIIAAVLSAMLVTAGFPVAASAAENEVLLGDADGSGAVDVTDATMIQMIAAELATVSAERLKAADVNGDGKVDVVDATLVQQYAAELIDDFKKTDKPVQPANPVTPTEPEQPTASQDKYTVVFSDTLGWGSPMYCYYYYSDGSYTTAWPGTAMTSIGNNAYSIDVPEMPLSYSFVPFSKP